MTLPSNIAVWGRNLVCMFALLGLANSNPVAVDAPVEFYQLVVGTDPLTGAPAFLRDGRRVSGPLIHVAPGELLVVALTNRLKENKWIEQDVNLHFHGLAIPESAFHDDVMFRSAALQQTIFYRFYIPENQTAGLYWYHAHAMRNSYWMVFNGIYGPLIVDGLGSRADIRGADQRLLVLSDRADVPNLWAIPPAARQRSINLIKPFLRLRPGLARDTDDVRFSGPCAANGRSHVTINDLRVPAIIRADRRLQFLRVLNASASRYFDLAASAGPLRIVAIDGGALGSWPGALDEIDATHYVLPPGGRVEFLLDSRQGEKLTSRCIDNGPDGDPQPFATLAEFRGVPTDPGPSAPVSRSTVRPRFPIVDTERSVILSDRGVNFFINGRRFSPSSPPLFAAKAGSIELWHIVNQSREAHAFHLHQVRVAEIRGEFALEWKDTVDVRPGAAGKPSSVDVLVDFREKRIKGMIMMHCHILDHEDGGMMAMIEVQ